MTFQNNKWEHHCKYLEPIIVVRINYLFPPIEEQNHKGKSTDNGGRQFPPQCMGDTK